MKKYDSLWNDINSLLSFLRSANAVALIEDYYAMYENDAPPELIQAKMDDLQKALDNA